MQYRVFNKQGEHVNIEYVCFGMLTMVDAWVHEFAHKIDLYDKDGVWIDWTRNDGDGFIEVVEDIKFLRGFCPDNFSKIQYLFPIGGNQEGVDLFIKYSKEILAHPLFSHMKLDNDDEYFYVEVDMEGKQMDETIYPLLFVRNLCEYSWTRLPFKKALSIGASPITAFFIAQVVGITTGAFDDREWYSMEIGDSSVLNAHNQPLGDLVEGIKGELPRLWMDRRWDETLQGYSSYGTYAEPYREWNDDDDDEWVSEDDDEWEEGVINSLPNHPITGLAATMTSSSVFRKVKDYPIDLQKSLAEMRPFTSEGFETFVKEIMKHV